MKRTYIKPYVDLVQVAGNSFICLSKDKTADNTGGVQQGPGTSTENGDGGTTDGDGFVEAKALGHFFDDAPW